MPVHSPGKLPIGVQLIGAPYQESNLLRVAWELQKAGVVSAPVAQSGGSRADEPVTSRREVLAGFAAAVACRAIRVRW